MATNDDGRSVGAQFSNLLTAARERAGLSVGALADRSRLTRRRITSLERGIDVPTETELGVLAQACDVAIFDLLPPGYSLRVLVDDPTQGRGEASGEAALDALLREYLAMVVELRAGNPVTVPSLRHDDLQELAAALGDTPEAIEARLVALLGDGNEARTLRAMILPSSAARAS
jgi:transcriptional regulator with XRE-family HTH domain